MKIHRPFGDLQLVADLRTHHPASGQLQALTFTSG
jgi:hypothetical protein